MNLAALRVRSRHLELARYLAALCVLLTLAGCAPARGQDAGAAGGYPSLHVAYTAARYAARPVSEPQAGGAVAWEARNAAHALHATFTAAGLDLDVRVPGTETRYRSAWRLAALGYGAQPRAAGPGSVRGTGQRIELARPGVTEWFVNTPAGLEHGFTLAERPAGAAHGAALRVVLRVSGDLTPAAEANGQRISLRDAAGRRILTYDGLRVWDAGGRALPARMVARAATVEFVVDDAAARYPLTIDPTFGLEAYLKASNSGAVDQFGDALAMSGDTVVVGAPGEDSAATTIDGDGSDDSAPGAGAAYVFVYEGGVWTQQAYLKASNAQGSISEGGDSFGWAVAISGHTIVIGA